MNFFKLERECKKLRFKKYLIYAVFILSWLLILFFVKELIDLSTYNKVSVSNQYIYSK